MAHLGAMTAGWRNLGYVWLLRCVVPHDAKLKVILYATKKSPNSSIKKQRAVLAGVFDDRAYQRCAWEALKRFVISLIEYPSAVKGRGIQFLVLLAKKCLRYLGIRPVGGHPFHIDAQ